jgi:hypothetical protein
MALTIGTIQRLNDKNLIVSPGVVYEGRASLR